ncbi:hypothetical protein QFC21_006636 [Naganishia friedmannii]|uniref:Uncharacterized protein n=1 Tax=Naganishia friedmannii TaxID=89922 RepID=A0ACC2V1P0_9TREE|nr:hypothetical protein QFC21_006636 [Naganishia friedmannii]
MSTPPRSFNPTSTETPIADGRLVPKGLSVAQTLEYSKEIQNLVLGETLHDSGVQSTTGNTTSISSAGNAAGSQMLQTTFDSLETCRHRNTLNRRSAANTELGFNGCRLTLSQPPVYGSSNELLAWSTSNQAIKDFKLAARLALTARRKAGKRDVMADGELNAKIKATYLKLCEAAPKTFMPIRLSVNMAEVPNGAAVMVVSIGTHLREGEGFVVRIEMGHRIDSDANKSAILDSIEEQIRKLASDKVEKIVWKNTHRRRGEYQYPAVQFYLDTYKELKTKLNDESDRLFHMWISKAGDAVKGAYQEGPLYPLVGDAPDES